MRPGHYRWIDHTADMAFEVEAASFAELLQTATVAIGDLLLGLEEGERLEEHPLVVEGHDREDVLVAWLGEGVILLETRDWVVRDARVEKADATGARGVLCGRALRRGEAPDRVVKAVTYHDLHVLPGGPGQPWRATVVLDL